MQETGIATLVEDARRSALDAVPPKRQHHAESPAAADPRNDMRLWRQVIAQHEAWDELIRWFEHDLFDQVNLLELLRG